MTRRLALTLAALAVLTATGLGLARAASEPPRAPQEVAAAVGQTLRCPTCQGLSIADSPSSIAEGMRRIVEKQAAAGRSPDEIRAYFAARYGEWVLLSPPRRGLNWALWLLPGGTVATGLLLAVRATRRRLLTPHSADAVPLDDVDDAAIDRARDVYADYRNGSCVPGPCDERIEAALELLTSIDENSDSDQPPPAAAGREEAMRRLAAALADQPPGRAESAAADAVAEAAGQVNAPGEAATEHPPSDSAEQTRAQPQPVRRRVRALAYTAGGAAFAFTLAGLLITNTTDRAPGEVITGLLPGGSPRQPSTQATVDVDALRAQARNNSKDPAAWIALGLVLDRQGRPGQAYQAYQRALDVDPGNTVARQRAGWALIRGGEPAEAIPLLKPAARREPPNPRSVLLLGLAQYGADRPDAEATLRRYLELAPNGPASPHVRALLDKQ